MKLTIKLIPNVQFYKIFIFLCFSNTFSTDFFSESDFSDYLYFSNVSQRIDSYKNQLSFLKSVFKKELNLNAIHKEDGLTALEIAIWQQRFLLAIKLIDQGANTNLAKNLLEILVKYVKCNTIVEESSSGTTVRVYYKNPKKLEDRQKLIKKLLQTNYIEDTIRVYNELLEYTRKDYPSIIKNEDKKILNLLENRIDQHLREVNKKIFEDFKTKCVIL